ncbi:DUF1304 domain-containing protein [Arthrobacter sp. H5]|uniref:DUF1304 domain-containing protein n=1 Tax=Arthrobacter sp. H5 TaxID=1267973 RepID=UPI0004B9F893|nr:DUF1304 domain-containing protein [Arthrobacter sp. H5]
MTLPLLSSVFAIIAGLIHVYIFVLESLRWRSPSVWRLFGVRSQEDAETLRPMAFNQGFYNLFLAAGVIAGLAFSGTRAGYGMAVLALASMLLAAVVLISSNRKMVVGAAIQGVPPLIALAGLAIPA